ncbi:alpha-glucan family phosphorylase [Candidatus Poribacteria bacterium]|nr:alpha-glucan family phosphorylase [Candidatus Poribacteria bacterium]
MVHDEFIYEDCIAYFSMEIGLQNEIHTYSGGLGILAGDMLRSAAELELPLVGITLVSRAGYLYQEIGDQGQQMEHEDYWKPEDWSQSLEAKIAVTIESRKVWVKGWLYLMEGLFENRKLPVILLDTDLDDNNDEDRKITHYLYGGDNTYRLKQEIVLGIGGVRMLRALGFNVRKYHLNEGHSALLTLELLRDHIYPEDEIKWEKMRYDIPAVRDLCVFTAHTPEKAGQDEFSYELFQKTLGDFIDMEILKSLAGEDSVNMTQLALNLSEYVNGVAKSHAETSRELYPGYHIRSVTNGVHPCTWTHESFAELYDKYMKGWRHEPELLVRADQIPDEAIWEAHMDSKKELISIVKKMVKVDMDKNIPILGFARRMTSYKRADIIFSDIDRLKSIADEWPFQLVFAGKAHPKDDEGKGIIKTIHNYIDDLSSDIRIAYLPNYNMDMALSIVSGVDIWLNTPLPPREASGTSGMKAAFNGVPNLSILDGWWIEGCIEGVTGWAIGDEDSDPDNDYESLYRKLEQTVLPMYHNDRASWISVMKGIISKNAPFFNSHRMMRRYGIEAYLF